MCVYIYVCVCVIGPTRAQTDIYVMRKPRLHPIDADDSGIPDLVLPPQSPQNTNLSSQTHVLHFRDDNVEQAPTKSKSAILKFANNTDAGS